MGPVLRYFHIWLSSLHSSVRVARPVSSFYSPRGLATCQIPRSGAAKNESNSECIPCRWDGKQTPLKNGLKLSADAEHTPGQAPGAPAPAVQPSKGMHLSTRGRDQGSPLRPYRLTLVTVPMPAAGDGRTHRGLCSQEPHSRSALWMGSPEKNLHRKESCT